MRKKNTNEQLHTQPQFRIKPVYAAVLLAVVVQTAQANPIGGTVAAGQASFATTGNTLNVTNTPGTIINWQGFSIGANEITHFAQQSASSAVLNRVISNNPSSILGTLQSNGRVFLINPGGIVFGAGATVDVAGMVASTLNLSDADFLAGRNHFTQVPGSANLSNAGNITAQNGGQIYLLAPDVENTGVITAPNGEILLAAGYSVDLVSTTNPNLRVNITAPAGDATNVGQLIAQSGSLGLFGTVVSNSGIVSADSATLQGGKIVFKATQRTEISGTVSANGSTGGTVQALGNQVGIMDGATVTANGTQGGGTILVGGDYQGKNPDVPNAQVTYVAPTANIHADATDNGNGGRVIVWADDTTRFYGSISARGGNNGGNGGFVETSGHNYLDFQGLVDTRAPQGKAGTLLLDPADIIIDNSTDNLAGGISPGTGFFSGATGNSTLTWATINNQLVLSSLTIQTNSVPTTGNGDIFINAGTTLTGAGALTLLANRDINFATGVSVSAIGDVNLIAGWNNTGWAVTGGTGNIAFGTSSLSTTGNLYASASNSITQLAGSSITANTLSITGDANGGLKLPGGVSLSGSNMVNTLAADIAIAGGGSLTFSNGQALTIGAGTFATGIAATGNTNPINITTTAGDITVNQNVTSAGPVSITAAGAITESGLGLINTTGLLTTRSVTGQTLNGANTVGIFDATNSTSGNIALTNTAATLTVTGININNTFATGSVTVNNTGAISITGTIAAAYGGAINLMALGAAGSIIESGLGLINTTGSLTTSSAGGTTLNGANTVGIFDATNMTSGDIALTNTSDFNLGTVANSAASGGIIIGGDSSITQTGSLTTSGGAISVTANTNLTMNGTTAQSFGAYGGTISYKATNGNVQLGLLDAGTGYVYVVAGGNITDGNGASTNNIKASYASLLASQADGGPGSIDVDTQVQSLTVDNSLVHSTGGQTNNPVTVRNSGSPLNVTVNSSSATGQLTITNDNTINVGHIGGATNTTLIATGTSSDITVMCNSCLGTLLSDGNIVLNAGRDILVSSDYVGAADGTVTATAGHDIRITSVAGSLTPYPAPAYIQAANGIDLTMQTGGLYIDGTALYPAYLQTTSGNINVASSTGFKNGSISGFGNTGALSAPLGRWLIWASDPSTVVYGGLVYDFKQYNTAFGGSVLGSGNGFIYTIAPTVAFGLTGAVSKIYDGTNTASLVAGNFLAPVGAIDGDTVNAPVSVTGSYDTQNVGTGKIVTASGSTAASNGGAAVYGYHYSASGAIGTITPASFTILVPPVIDEIVDISNQNHKKPEDVLAGDIPTGEGGNTSTLPMCRP